MGFVSPNEMMQHARDAMLDGREPSTQDDWVLVMNYIAYNIQPSVAEQVCLLMAMIYNVPLSREWIIEIAVHQSRARQAFNN